MTKCEFLSKKISLKLNGGDYENCGQFKRRKEKIGL